MFLSMNVSIFPTDGEWYSSPNIAANRIESSPNIALRMIVNRYSLHTIHQEFDTRNPLAEVPFNLAFAYQRKDQVKSSSDYEPHGSRT